MHSASLSFWSYFFFVCTKMCLISVDMVTLAHNFAVHMQNDALPIHRHMLNTEYARRLRRASYKQCIYAQYCH